MNNTINSKETDSLIFFTICSRNFLAQAQVLHNGVTRYHPNSTFYLVLCDDMSDVDFSISPFEVISIYDLGIPSLQEMVNNYNITELNTALKPFGFLSIFERHNGASVIYLDPDIMVMSPFEEVVDLLIEQNYDCVLTPHVCEPAEFAEIDESKMLQYGIYNLGFCALKDTDEVRRVVSWWGRRLEKYCIIDLKSGLFVDQKWADLLPSFIERTAILRHPGYNVAYWNLSQRTVRKDQSSEETKWFVNCQPLRFFHFSGSVVDDPIIFSRHSNQFTLETLRDVEILFRIYVEETHKCGRSKYKNINYSYSWNGAGKVNLHTPYILTNNIEQQHAKWSVQIGSNLLIRNQDAWIGIGNAVEIGGWDAYQKHRHSIINSYKNRVLFEQSLLPNDDASSFYTSGHCCICGVKANFITSFMYSVEKTPDGRSMPNWREHMQCEHCGLVNRVRAALHALFSVSTPESSSAIYITEHMTSTYTWLKDRFNNLSSSEYFGPSYFPGTIIDGIRHENIMELSFDDLTFDKILSFDVLEHVPEPYKAFSELYRVLKNEGELIFSVPFSTDSKFDIIRAEITKNGIINHILPPEYHGNPVDQEGGSLCFRYFGWDMLDRLRALGFVNVRALCYWSDDQGYLGEEQILFFAQK